MAAQLSENTIKLALQALSMWQCDSLSLARTFRDAASVMGAGDIEKKMIDLAIEQETKAAEIKAAYDELLKV